MAVAGKAAWGIPARNDLASIHNNRAKIHYENGDLAAAIHDYNTAIRLREDIRETLLVAGGEAAWSILLRNDYAITLMSRGSAHMDAGDLGSGIADCGKAINVCESIHDTLRAAGQERSWSIHYRAILASVRQSRSRARRTKGELAAAIADCDVAIQLYEDVRDILLTIGGEAGWSISYRFALGNALNDRGLVRADNGDLDSGIADYDSAIALLDGIRNALLESGGPMAGVISCRHRLAIVHQNRGSYTVREAISLQPSPTITQQSVSTSAQEMTNSRPEARRFGVSPAATI